MKNLQKILVAILPIMAACVAETPENPDVPKDAMELFVEPAFCWNGTRTQPASFFGPEGIVLEEDAARTKVSFSGIDENGTAVSETSLYERIDWKADDSERLRMLFYDENGQLLAGEDDEYHVNAEYKIKRMDGGRETNLPWADGQGENRVFAVYPSSASLSYSRSSNTLTVGNVHLASSFEEGYESDFADPDMIKVWPKSGQMYLYGGLSVPAGAPKGQSILFQPMFNAVQLLVSPPADPTSVFYGAKLMKVSLLSQDKSALAGKNATVTVTDATEASASRQRSTDKLTVTVPDKDASDEIVLAFSSGEAPTFDRLLDITLLTFPQTYDKLTLQLEFEKNGTVFAAVGDLSRTGGAFLPATKTRITNQSDPGNAFTFDVRQSSPTARFGAGTPVGERHSQPLGLIIDSCQSLNGADTFLDWTTEQWDSTAQRWIPLNHDLLIQSPDTLAWIEKKSFPWKHIGDNPQPRNNSFLLYAWGNRVRREWEGPVGNDFSMYNNASPGSAHDLSAHDIFGNPNEHAPNLNEIQQTRYQFDIKNIQDWIAEVYATYTPEELEDLNNSWPDWNHIPTFDEWLQQGAEGSLFSDGKVHETANCYVVSAPGYYTFPMIAGNAVNEKYYPNDYNFFAMGNWRGTIGRDSGQNHFEEMGKHGANGINGSDAVPLWYYDYNNYDYVTGSYARVEEQMSGNNSDRPVWNTLYAFPGYDDWRMSDYCSFYNKSTFPLRNESGDLITYSASLLWQDIKGMISDISVTNTNGAPSNPTVPMVTFKVNGDAINQANAVIAIKDENGAIVWSWHIWIMERQKLKVFDIGQSEMFGMSVGFCEGDYIPQPERNVKVRFTQNGSGLRRTLTLSQLPDKGPFYSNLFYQWGRKDPFYPKENSPGSTSYIKKVFSGNGTEVYFERVLFGSSPVNNTFGQMIRNPMTIFCATYYNTSSTYQRALLNLWDRGCLERGEVRKTEKTVYDPCPPGFCVPGFASIKPLATEKNEAGGYSDIVLPCIERGKTSGTSDKQVVPERLRFAHTGWMGNSPPQSEHYYTFSSFAYDASAYFLCSAKKSGLYDYLVTVFSEKGEVYNSDYNRDLQGFPVRPVRDTHHPVTGAGVTTSGQQFRHYDFGFSSDGNKWKD